MHSNLCIYIRPLIKTLRIDVACIYLCLLFFLHLLFRFISHFIFFSLFFFPFCVVFFSLSVLQNWLVSFRYLLYQKPYEQKEPTGIDALEIKGKTKYLTQHGWMSYMCDHPYILRYATQNEKCCVVGANHNLYFTLWLSLMPNWFIFLYSFISI